MKNEENDQARLAPASAPQSSADPRIHLSATPGPWTVETQWASDVDDNQFPFAHWIAGPEGEQIAEQVFEKPDAQLIAASPDLLAACKAVTPICLAINSIIDGDEDLRARFMVQLIAHGHQGDYADLVNAAVRKAEGREP